MPSLAEVLDAVVGVDTHRDTHQAEIALPSGKPIAAIEVSNDSGGYAQLLAWIIEHSPGPRLAVSIEGTRSYGIGVARALAAAGLMVIECQQPDRRQRRGKGQVRPDRCSPRGAGSAATRRGPGAHTTRGRRPGSAEDPADRTR